MMEWIGKRYANFCTINQKISRISAGMVIKFNYPEDARVILGFSEDRNRLYIKKSNNGVKLSLINSRSKGRTFSSVALINQFGEDIIGRYEFESYDENEETIVLKKVM